MDPAFPIPKPTAKRALEDWQCSFTSEFSQPVSSIDYETNTFECDTPVFTRQGFYDFWLSYRGERFTSDQTQFQVVDCDAVPVCGLCILSPACGWCPGSITCSTKELCDLEPIPIWNSTTITVMFTHLHAE
jgi:hypothetical protein